MKSFPSNTASRAPADEHERVRSRRRAGKIWGLVILAATSATACIFDESTYKGGGRQDRGATAGTAASGSGSPTDVPTGTATTPSGDGGGDDDDAG